MIKNKQLIVDVNHGDCLRACITSILDIKNSEKIPRTAGNDRWFIDWHNFLGQFGISLWYDEKKIWRSGYWIGSVPSKNYLGVYHAVVMKGHKVFHDPSTKKRYRSGTPMLGKDMVNGGWWLEIDDASKLPKLFEYIKKQKI